MKRPDRFLVGWRENREVTGNISEIRGNIKPFTMNEAKVCLGCSICANTIYELVKVKGRKRK
jgi:hypothetical protein